MSIESIFGHSAFTAPPSGLDHDPSPYGKDSYFSVLAEESCAIATG